MASEKALVLVLRVVEFSETSCIVALFSREFGKIQALAKGARRPKGPFESALDLLCLCRVVFLRKSTEGLDLLTEAKLERRFRGRGRDLSCHYAGYYVAELLDGLTDDDDPHPELFDSALATLSALGEHGSPAALVLWFELTALRLLGHLPSLEACVECGAPVARTGRVAFGPTVGGVICRDCRPGKQWVVSVSATAMAAMDTLVHCSLPQLPPAELPAPICGELRGIMNRFMAHLLGHPPRLQAYLPR